MDADLTALLRTGKTAFGRSWRPERVAIAPGRLELLGNHVDYNGGLVLAGAIDRVVRAAGGPADMDEDTILLTAPDIDSDVATISVRDPELNAVHAATTPADYLTGIVKALTEAEIEVRGGQAIAVSGDVPVGFGMSSSAALCVSLTLVLAAASLPDDQLVTIARRAEHLTGAPVGAMDQSASVAGGVILFDGATNRVERLEPNLGNHVFAVANSGVHHALNTSQYPVRVRESEEALALLREHAGLEIDALGQLTPEQWDPITSKNPAWLSPALAQRVRHVVNEVARVREGVSAIRDDDWERFGTLMTASGQSSAKDYEISHPVVEELVALLRAQPGVLGARMMGGGEGGPALALLRRDAVEDVRAALDGAFFAPRGMDARSAFEVCAFGPGASLEDIMSPM